MMRRFFVMIAAAITTLAVITGCGAGSSGSSTGDESVSSGVSDEAAADTGSDDAAADSAVSAANFSTKAGDTDSDDTDSTATGNENSSADDVDPLPEFDTVDLEGNRVTNAVFVDKDVTMINFWGTFCSPCIDEMPELEKLSQSLPENAQIIGVVTDALADSSGSSGVTQEAQRIVNLTGVTYPNILLDNALYTYAIQNIQFVPTTLFVDGDGTIIGEVVGSDMDGYVEQLEDRLDGWTYDAQ